MKINTENYRQVRSLGQEVRDYATRGLLTEFELIIDYVNRSQKSKMTGQMIGHVLGILFDITEAANNADFSEILPVLW